MQLRKACGSVQPAKCGPSAAQAGLPGTVALLVQTLQRIARCQQQPQQQRRQPRSRAAPPVPASATPKEAAAAAQPGRAEGSQRRAGTSRMFASASPRAAALAAQPSCADGSQPRSAEPSDGRPEAAAATRAGARDPVGTAGTVSAAQPSAQDENRAQAGGQAARAAWDPPGALQRQRSGLAAGEAQPQRQRHWRWPREWALPHWQPPQLNGFVLPAWAAQAVGGKQKLLTVQQFFNYVESEGAPCSACLACCEQPSPVHEWLL